MSRVPTVPTLEKGLQAPIRPVLEAAMRVGLRRVAWVDSHYIQARFVCFVYHKLPPLCKAPGMQLSLPLTVDNRTTALSHCRAWIPLVAEADSPLHDFL